MSISPLGNKFRASFGAGESRKRTNHATVELAQEWLDAREAEREAAAAILMPPAPISNVWTLKKALSHTVKHHWTAGGGIHTAVRNSEYALEFFGSDTPIDAITSVSVLSYMEWLMETKNNSPSTLNKKLSALSVVLTNALDIGGIDTLPRMKRRKEDKKAPHWYSKDDEKNMLRIALELGHQGLHDFIIFGFDLGMRRMELLNLKMADYHMGSLLIHADRTKGRVGRAVPASVRVREMLDGRPAGQVMIFAGFTVAVHRTQWEDLRAAMGRNDDPFFITHTLRHTCATRLLSAGSPIKAVQAWLGHESMASTMVYGHLEPGQLDQARDALEAFNRA
jgi:integrase